MYVNDKRSNGELCSPQLSVSLQYLARIINTIIFASQAVLEANSEHGHLFGCSNQDRRVGSCSIILRTLTMSFPPELNTVAFFSRMVWTVDCGLKNERCDLIDFLPVVTLNWSPPRCGDQVRSAVPKTKSKCRLVAYRVPGTWPSQISPGSVIGLGRASS